MFREVLKQLRRSRGLTQAKLGCEIHVDQSVISNWEKGKKCPNLSDLMTLADFFNVTLDQLAGRDIPPSA